MLAQWIFRRLDGAPTGGRSIGPEDRDRMRAELAALQRQVRNMDARLDFTEQLLDGALALSPPPARLDPDEAGLDEGGLDHESPDPRDADRGPR